MSAALVAVLFARADSVYKTMRRCDVYDIDRDARKWPGGAPVVAHPPCRLWGRLRQFAKAADPRAERQLAVDAVERIRLWGGVLEHPAGSTLWAYLGLPTPGRAPDAFGGWTAEIRQCDFGHKADKLTWLYIVGCHPDELPTLPKRGEPTGYIRTQLPMSKRVGTIVTKAEREHTPLRLAEWLVELARRCETHPKGDQPRSERGREVMEPEACASATGRGTDGVPARATLPHASPGGSPMGAGQAAAAAPSEATA